jgi:hypothetical protein
MRRRQRRCGKDMKGTVMRNLTKYAAAALAGALAIGVAGTGVAAPQSSGVRAASHTTDISAQRRHARVVHRRGYRRGYAYGPGPAVAGAALGIIGAGVAAATAPRYYYSEPYPYYGAPAYGYGYDPYW